MVIGIRHVVLSLIKLFGDVVVHNKDGKYAFKGEELV
eukprot:UN05221